MQEDGIGNAGETLQCFVITDHQRFAMGVGAGHHQRGVRPQVEHLILDRRSRQHQPNLAKTRSNTRQGRIAS